MCRAAASGNPCDGARVSECLDRVAYACRETPATETPDAEAPASGADDLLWCARSSAPPP